jgi:DNA-binding HxlR family transcriptional regulator
VHGRCGRLVSESEGTDWKREWHGLWSILSCKWTFHVLRLLSMDDRGFNEIKRELDGITATMLSRRLKQLEGEGLVEREVLDTTPPTTNYSLTETGTELAAILREIEELQPLSDDE